MGTTLANLQIRTTEPIDSSMLMKAYNFSDGWATVLGEAIQAGTAQKAARKLSKAIGNPILSVECFDDDVLVLGVFKGGKQVAGYVSDTAYGMTRKPGNAAVFVKELLLEEGDVKYLKYVFNCEDLRRQVSMLEKILACPLLVDERALEVIGEEEFRREHELGEIEEYIAEIKKQERVPVITIAHQEESLPKYDHFFKEDCIKVFFHGGKIRETPIHCDVFLSDDKKYLCIYDQFEQTAAIMNDVGDVIADLNLPKHMFPLLMLDDGTLICQTQEVNSSISRVDKDGRKMWEYKVGYVYAVTLHNNYLILHYENRDSGIYGEIIHLDLDGSLHSRASLIPRGGWNQFLIDKSGNIYYCCGIRDEKFLLCYNENLQEIKRLKIEFTSFEGLLDEQNEVVYIYFLDKGMIAVDLNKFTVIASLQCTEVMHLSHVDENGYLVVRQGNTKLFAYNMNLQLMARYKEQKNM